MPLYCPDHLNPPAEFRQSIERQQAPEIVPGVAKIGRVLFLLDYEWAVEQLPDESVEQAVARGTAWAKAAGRTVDSHRQSINKMVASGSCVVGR